MLLNSSVVLLIASILIAYNSADDDFDMDDGFRGKIQYAISVKDPAFTDNKGTTGDISNNFEVDNVNPANGFLWTQHSNNFPSFDRISLLLVQTMQQDQLKIMAMVCVGEEVGNSFLRILW